MICRGLINSWGLYSKADEIASRAENLIKNCKKVYDSIGAVRTEDVNFNNTLRILAEVKGDFRNEFQFLKLPSQLSPQKELRDASNDAVNKLSTFNVEVSMRTDVFEKLVALQEKKMSLEPQYQRYLEMLITEGKRNALHLSEETQNKVKEMRNRINSLCSQFVKNLNEDVTVVEFTEEELEGMPIDFINELEKSPDTGKRKVTLKYPHYLPIMGKAHNPETRKKMLFTYNTQCLDNLNFLTEAITLRHDLAQLLGYLNHATFATETCHSQTADRVSSFLQELKERLQPAWKQEEIKLLILKENECEKLGIPYDGKLNDYDIRYYSRKYKELYYHIDEDKFQEYFPLEVVTKGLLDIYQKLLGLTFKEVENSDVWHSDVRMFSVEDSSTNNLVGYFYLDLFPREGKYGHAALFPIQSRHVKQDGSVVLPAAVIMANFTMPTSTRPSLLRHNEVRTYFHEFGHVMHQLCANCDISCLNSVLDMSRDFIETPSMMLENWVWAFEPLQMMSSHYIDKTPLPAEMIESLIKSKRANIAGGTLRTVALSTVDLRLHTQREVNPQSVYNETITEIMGIPPLEGTSFMCNFRHMAELDYDAKYYGYLWCEVSSCDMFDTRFNGENILNSDVGIEYRKKVLEVGQRIPIDEIIHSFLGRDRNQDAFLADLGLAN